MAAIARSVFVAQGFELPAPPFPIDIAMLLLGIPTGVANAVIVECNCLFLGVLGVLVLNRGVWPLV